MVRQWMENMGCERIFEVNNVTREGIQELLDYLKDDLPKLTLEQAKFKQSLGLNEWQPLAGGRGVSGEYQISWKRLINMRNIIREDQRWSSFFDISSRYQ